jgi:hypothetical protein
MAVSHHPRNDDPVSDLDCCNVFSYFDHDTNSFVAQAPGWNVGTQLSVEGMKIRATDCRMSDADDSVFSRLESWFGRLFDRNMKGLPFPENSAHRLAYRFLVNIEDTIASNFEQIK